MAETIFKSILAGHVPCYRILEDAHCLAFLDISPLSAGHVLLIPKEPAETLDALSDQAAAALGRVLPRLCRAVVAATGHKAYHVLQNNGALAHQAVQHVHFHIIPKPSDAAGLNLVWQPQAYSSNDLQAMAGALVGALKGDKDGQGQGCN